MTMRVQAVCGDAVCVRFGDQGRQLRARFNSTVKAPEEMQHSTANKVQLFLLLNPESAYYVFAVGGHAVAGSTRTRSGTLFVD